MRDLDLTVAAGEVVALLGANGAGKTTTLRAISGLVQPMAGRIVFAGEDLAGLSPQARARLGIAHVPEGRGIFFGLTVAEHFRLGHRGERLDAKAGLRLLPGAGASFARGAPACCPAASSRCWRSGAHSPGGRSCSCSTSSARPRARDRRDPAADRPPTTRRSRGCAVLLVEQHVHLALEVADRGYVLSHGEIVLHDTAEKLRADRHLLIASYLGEQAEEAGALGETTPDGAAGG